MTISIAFRDPKVSSGLMCVFVNNIADRDHFHIVQPRKIQEVVVPSVTTGTVDADLYFSLAAHIVLPLHIAPVRGWTLRSILAWDFCRILFECCNPSLPPFIILGFGIRGQTTAGIKTGPKGTPCGRSSFLVAYIQAPTDGIGVIRDPTNGE